MKRENPYSPYIAAWVVLVPTKGCVTLHDQRVFNRLEKPWARRKDFWKHFANREEAEKWLTTFSGELDHCYECRICTDKQFGMAKMKNGRIVIPFTVKQREQIYRIE